MPIKGKAGAQFSHYDEVERTGCRFIKGELETEVARFDKGQKWWFSHVERGSKVVKETKLLKEIEHEDFP